jgi:hypothetical protein
MDRAARLEKEMSSQLSGEQGGEAQWTAQLNVQLAKEQKTVERFRAALENARRDLNWLAPRSDTGSRKAKLIKAAVERIETVLRETP